VDLWTQAADCVDGIENCKMKIWWSPRRGY
jgi:hypothetical protein